MAESPAGGYRSLLRLSIATTQHQYRYLAQKRLEESMALLKAEEWTGALYLAGYVIECGIKAVLATGRGGRLPVSLHTHDLEALRAQVRPQLAAADFKTLAAIPAWSHLIRYSTTSPTPAYVVRFINCAKESSRCLQTYL